MFNLQPGQGLGFTASRLIAFGLDGVGVIKYPFLVAVRSFNRARVNINKKVIIPVSEKVKQWL